MYTVALVQTLRWRTSLSTGWIQYRGTGLGSS